MYGVSYKRGVRQYHIIDLQTGVLVTGLVLHEENIALLSESHQKLKEMAATRRLKTGTNCLIGEQFLRGLFTCMGITIMHHVLTTIRG